MWLKLRNYFITGFLVVLPIVGTYAALRFLFSQLNAVLLTPVLDCVYSYIPGFGIGHVIAKTLILIAFIVCIIVIGLAARLILLRRFFGMLEKVFVKLPLISKIYMAIKEISAALFGQHKAVFKRVVMIEYPRKGVYSIAFVTVESMPLLTKTIGKEGITLFIPTTPNPTSGILLIVPTEDVVAVDMTIEEAFKLIVSGGAVQPPRHYV